MQLVAVLAFMLVLPIVSTALQVLVHGAELIPAALKWFVFWGVGARLATSAIRQIVQPGFTASEIFDIDDPKAARLVMEIGFGNLAIGLIALLSLVFPNWTTPAAVAGAVFFALAGLQHVRNDDRTGAEQLALVSDLVLAAVLLGLLALQFV